MIIVGIDPGLSGAVAIHLGMGKTIEIHDTPVATTTGTKREYLPAAMASIIQGYIPDMVYVERQRPMPKQGVTSTFSLGYGYGLWLGILATLGYPYETVEPTAWKKDMMAGMSKEKSASVIKAMQIFPDLNDQLYTPRGKALDGRADAVLIAEYGRRRQY